VNSKGEQAFLDGEKIYLRPLREEDADGDYPDWLNDEETSRGNSHHVFPYARSQALDYIRDQAGCRDRIVLAIVEKASRTHIGNVALQGIDYINRSAELAILLGDGESRGKGYGLEACRLLVAHGFAALGLNRIGFGTPEFNIGMQRIGEKLGMKKEGVKRRAFFKAGRFHDVVLFGLTSEDMGKGL
jgi:RimJ/RimL family protein N-acetyltransferase